MIHFSISFFDVSTVCDESSTKINSFDVRPYVFSCKQILKFLLQTSLPRETQRKIMGVMQYLSSITGFKRKVVIEPFLHSASFSFSLSNEREKDQVSQCTDLADMI